jgi:cell wall-associated NlpC family hydrolase
VQLTGLSLVGAFALLCAGIPVGSAAAQNMVRVVTWRDSIVALARAQIGKRYRFGGESPEHGFDCSGLVHYVMAALHVDLPRTAHDQAHVGASLPQDPEQLLPGDLVTFGTKRTISHIAIYIGDGRIIQASSKAGRVIETPLFRHPATGVQPWRGARRVEPDVDPTLILPVPTLPLVGVTAPTAGDD